MSENELNTAARDLLAVRAMIEELQAEAEALTDKIKGAMVDRGQEVLTGDGWKASWKNVNTKANGYTAQRPGGRVQYSTASLKLTRRK